MESAAIPATWGIVDPLPPLAAPTRRDRQEEPARHATNPRPR